MEFNVKLQQLRKQNNYTQEQLAELLYVSRTAVSKWESGRGYPNIDSLKAISKLFSVSIDELLSSDELIAIAKNENRYNIDKVFDLVYGIMDLISVAFLFLPLFSQKAGERYYFVSLINFSDTSLWIISFSFAFVILLTVVGLVELLIRFKDNKNLWRRINALSLLISICAIILFISTRQLYVTALLFIFFIIKGSLKLKSSRLK